MNISCRLSQDQETSSSLYHDQQLRCQNKFSSSLLAVVSELPPPPPPRVFVGSNYLLKARTASAGAKQTVDYRAARLCAASIAAGIKR